MIYNLFVRNNFVHLGFYICLFSFEVLFFAMPRISLINFVSFDFLFLALFHKVIYLFWNWNFRRIMFDILYLISRIDFLCHSNYFLLSHNFALFLYLRHFLCCIFLLICSFGILNRHFYFRDFLFWLFFRSFHYFLNVIPLLNFLFYFLLCYFLVRLFHNCLNISAEFDLFYSLNF